MFSSFGDIIYTVVPGDTLGKIANKYNTTSDAIFQVNDSITDLDVIQVGQIITIPTAMTTSNIVTKAPIPKVSLLPFLQGNMFGYPKIYVYSAILVAAALIFVPLIKRQGESHDS